MNMNKYINLILIIFIITICSCAKIDQFLDELTQLREQSVLTLNDGINAIQNESADWQSVLKELSEKIDIRVQDILTYNIPYIASLATQRALSSILCVKENVKDGVIYYLEVARAELITGVLPPLPETTICLTSISTIDLNSPRNIRNQIIYTGYYIHSKDSILACFINGNSVFSIPVTELGFPDISNITLSLTKYTDVFISGFTHLQLKYNNEVISSIGIDKVISSPSVPEMVKTNFKTIVWIPPHTNGDKEFDGHGPKMKSHVYLKHDGFRVYAQIYLWAQETKHDWTTASGYSQWVEIYSAPNSYRINKIKDPTVYSNILRSASGIDYIDSNTQDHIIETTIGRATLVGDTNGSEAGSKTKITLGLKQFFIEIQKL